MRTTTFTFRYWDQYEITQHSFDVLVTTPLSEPPFTPRLDVIRMFTSPFTVFPSTTPVFTILTTYLFETFTSIPPRLDSTSTPIHFIFRGAHFDTLINSPTHSHRIGDIYRLNIFFDHDGSRVFDHSDVTIHGTCIPHIELIDQTPHHDLILTEPPPLEVNGSFVTLHTIPHLWRRFLSVSTVIPPHSYIALPYVRTIDGLVNWDHSHRTLLCDLHSSSLVDISAVATWDVSHIDCLSSAFRHCHFLTDLTPISSWDTSHVTRMSEMFYGCKSLTDLTPISSWDTSNVIDMEGMFAWCLSLAYLDAIARWDTSKTIHMGYMFMFCESIRNVDAIARWNVSELMMLHFMFMNCIGLTDVSGLAEWDTSKFMKVRSMMFGCTRLTDRTAVERWALPLIRKEIHEKLRRRCQHVDTNEMYTSVRVADMRCDYDKFMDLIGDVDDHVDADDEMVSCVVKRLFTARRNL